MLTNRRVAREGTYYNLDLSLFYTNDLIRTSEFHVYIPNILASIYLQREISSGGDIIRKLQMVTEDFEIFNECIKKYNPNKVDFYIEDIFSYDQLKFVDIKKSNRIIKNSKLKMIEFIMKFNILKKQKITKSDIVTYNSEPGGTLEIDIIDDINITPLINSFPKTIDVDVEIPKYKHDLYKSVFPNELLSLTMEFRFHPDRINEPMNLDTDLGYYIRISDDLKYYVTRLFPDVYSDTNVSSALWLIYEQSNVRSKDERENISILKTPELVEWFKNNIKTFNMLQRIPGTIDNEKYVRNNLRLSSVKNGIFYETQSCGFCFYHAINNLCQRRVDHLVHKALIVGKQVSGETNVIDYFDKALIVGKQVSGETNVINYFVNTEGWLDITDAIIATKFIFGNDNVDIIRTESEVNRTKYIGYITLINAIHYICYRYTQDGRLLKMDSSDSMVTNDSIFPFSACIGIKRNRDTELIMCTTNYTF